MIDLVKIAGKRWNLGWDQARAAESPEFRAQESPHLRTIPCRRGHLFVWGPDRLAASCDSRGPTATKLAGMKGVRVEQDGSDGLTISFPLSLLKEVAALMLPRCRRVLSPEQRKKAAERLARVRPKPLRQAPYFDGSGDPSA